MTQAVNDAAARSVNLTMLERGTTYRVRLAGMNVRGLGAWSPYMEVATPVDRKWWMMSLMDDVAVYCCLVLG